MRFISELIETVSEEALVKLYRQEIETLKKQLQEVCIFFWSKEKSKLPTETVFDNSSIILESIKQLCNEGDVSEVIFPEIKVHSFF